MIIMDLSKSTLRIFRGLAESNPKKASVAERICKKINFPFNKDKFKRLKATTRESEYSKTPIDCILIQFEDNEIEITILDDRYFVTNRYNDNEYQFVKQYLYENNYLLEESFSLEADEETFVAITECYPSSAVCIENDEKSIMRCHREDSYIDHINNTIVSMKSFINEITDKEEYLYQELIYFLEKDGMYNINIRTSNNSDNKFLAGISTDTPKEMLNNEDLTEDELRLFLNLGMIDNSPVKHPKIYFSGTYVENETLKTFEIHILKDSKGIFIRRIDNKEKQLIKISNAKEGAFRIEELEFVKNNLDKITNDKPYTKWVSDYLDEVIYRLNEKYTKGYFGLTSYNKDIFDYMIIEGKDLTGGTENPKIEKRAYDLYMRKSIIRNYLDDINLEPLSIDQKEVKHL